MKLLDRSLLLAIASLVATLGLAGCRSGGGDGDDDDDDADGDADSDSDTDVDSDSDGDGDGDTDADTDTDGDTDADSDGDADIPCDGEETDATCSDGQDNNGNDYTDCTDFCCSRNAAVTVCPAQDVTVQDVRQGEVDPFTLVRLEGMLVTAVEGTSWYMQDADAESPDFSGIYVFIPNSNPDEITIPAVGDIIDVMGEYSEFWNLSEIAWIHELEIVSSGNPDAAPVAVAPEDIGDEDGSAGDRAEALESVVVTTNGAVTNLEPALGAGDRDPSNEFVIDDVLRVDDRMYLVEPQVDDQISVTGPLRFGNEHFKIEPRWEEDVELQ